MKCERCNKEIESGILNVVRHYEACPGQMQYIINDSYNSDHYMIAGAKAMNAFAETLRQVTMIDGVIHYNTFDVETSETDVIARNAKLDICLDNGNWKYSLYDNVNYGIEDGHILLTTSYMTVHQALKQWDFDFKVKYKGFKTWING